MKLLLIHAWNETEVAYRGRFSSLLSYPSLTLAVLYSLVPEGMFGQIDVVDENSQRVQYDRTHYDVVMISFETSSALSAYRHADAFRERGSYVVCGGYHATAMPEEALQHCDTVIIGPAEISIPAFLHDFAAGAPKARYHNPIVCAAEYPIPARDVVTKHRKLRIPAVIADRGCNNRCKYCSMSMMWRSDPRPVESVVEEVRSLHTKMVIFYDPNFFAKREYALSLMKALEPLHILWASNATADFGYDHELMEAAYRSGCRGVLIGLESLNTSSLRSVGKRFQETDKYKTVIANIHSHGMAVNGCFVLGFDSDTEEELLALPERVDRLGLDLCRFAVLTPYPGTKLYEDYEKHGRILTHEWSRYNQHTAVFSPVNLSAGRLDAIYRQVWREAYSWKRVLRRTFTSPWRFHPYVFILLGANIGFKFLGIDQKRNAS
ncbi:MAG: B12-binding domain-containing radical SAM protein [Oscillospiraceae bacterium]|nr:B12-binding domain-containing radical SAM protein [Oscillospiraceae bacterium]